jgi:hypothetical protein
MKNYIIAGTYEQYKHWLRTKIFSPSTHVYVTNSDTLIGVYNPRGWFIGTWRDRDDMEEIFEVLLRATDITTESHRRINAAWGKWNLL